MTDQDAIDPLDPLVDVIRKARSDAYTDLLERWGDRDAGPVSVHDEAAHMDRAALLSALGHDDCVPREGYDGLMARATEWRERAERAEAKRDIWRGLAIVRQQTRAEAERDRRREGMRELAEPWVPSRLPRDDFDAGYDAGRNAAADHARFLDGEGDR